VAVNGTEWATTKVIAHSCDDAKDAILLEEPETNARTEKHQTAWQWPVRDRSLVGVRCWHKRLRRRGRARRVSEKAADSFFAID
jgi:hypothetical protein